jgi:hypothetical protein
VSRVSDVAPSPIARVALGRRLKLNLALDVSESEYLEIRRIADLQGMAVDDYIRELVAISANAKPEAPGVRHRVTLTLSSAEHTALTRAADAVGQALGPYILDAACLRASGIATSDEREVG